jgi:hypothetical protein
MTDSIQSLVADAGYSGDVDTTYDSPTDTWSDDERPIARKRKRQPGLQHEYSRRRHYRQAHSSGSTSLIELSKFLQQHFKSTGPQQQQVPEPQQFAYDSVWSKIPSVLSPLFQTLEDALGFTSHPRILMEAEAPYRVVRANAAYDRLRQKESPYFGTTCDLLTIYPVVGSEHHAGDIPHVTHYLVEANDGASKTSSLEQHKHAIG